MRAGRAVADTSLLQAMYRARLADAPHPEPVRSQRGQRQRYAPSSAKWKRRPGTHVVDCPRGGQTTCGKNQPCPKKSLTRS
jgi:hypothetical protein